jgi:hypothetical protein
MLEILPVLPLKSNLSFCSQLSPLFLLKHPTLLTPSPLLWSDWYKETTCAWNSPARAVRLTIGKSTQKIWRHFYGATQWTPSNKATGYRVEETSPMIECRKKNKHVSFRCLWENGHQLLMSQIHRCPTSSYRKPPLDSEVFKPPNKG